MANVLDREACERRAYRLAVLLTGHRLAATRVIDAVTDAQPRPERLDGVRLDRLTVLHARELEPAMLVDAGLPPRAAAALADLPEQAREAWVLRRVFLEEERDAARAMDCSRSAHARHLEAADAALGAEAARAFREWIVRIAVPSHFHQHRRVRRIVRRHGRRLLLVAVVVLAGAALVVAWSEWRARTGAEGRGGDAPAASGAP